jgi:beta-galactosidase GanA
LTHAIRSVLLAALLLASPATADESLPHLARRGPSTALIVDGAPFLILGGELGNSSAASRAVLDPIWPRLRALGLNTVLVPVSWELVEPVEGRFDFALLTHTIDEARRQGLHLVLLWFGSWKNGMSSYAPAWVKTDQARFPRAARADGRGVESLSAFSDAGCEADARAFTALMRHLRAVDGRRHTVLMVQVENEVAMIDEAADRSPLAARAFAAPVPKPLTEALRAQREGLAPELRARWARSGFKESGTWAELFGDDPGGQEIFMAWHYARYVDRVAQAGKAVYPLPMFVNAALNRPGLRPGQYPSAGPLPHLADVWRAGAPHVDLLAPDIYYGDPADWCAKYARAGNPLFVPETANDGDNAVTAFYGVGQHHALGWSPFAVDAIEDPAHAPLARAYEILRALAPIVSGSEAASGGVLLGKESPRAELHAGGYVVRAAHDFTFPWSKAPRDPAAPWPRAAGLVVATGPDEFVVAGSGVIFTFAADARGDPAQTVGLLSVDEGSYQRGVFVVRRRLNGDETHQGRHVRIPAGSFAIQRVKLYRYR